MWGVGFACPGFGKRSNLMVRFGLLRTEGGDRRKGGLARFAAGAAYCCRAGPYVAGFEHILCEKDGA